jgi:galactose mutarotase-like enzyme
MSELPDGSGIRLSLQDTAATLAVFPHRFQLDLELRPEPQALSILARVGNPAGAGEPPLPFSLGLHPYFAVADLGAVRLSGLPAQAVDQTVNATGDTAALLGDLTRGVDVLAGPTPAVRLETDDIAITLETQAPLDLAVMWTDPPRPMVCLEPWTAPRGALTSGERLLHVPAGESVELACRYRVEALRPS